MINERDKVVDSPEKIYLSIGHPLGKKSVVDLGLSPSSPTPLDSQKDCDHCKTGKKQLDAFISWKKEKKIPYYKLLLILKDCGSRCVSCQYNNIKGRKTKVYSKIPRLNFQQLDMFEPIEEVKKT